MLRPNRRCWHLWTPRLPVPATGGLVAPSPPPVARLPTSLGRQSLDVGRLLATPSVRPDRRVSLDEFSVGQGGLSVGDSTAAESPRTRPRSQAAGSTRKQARLLQPPRRLPPLIRRVSRQPHLCLRCRRGFAITGYQPPGRRDRPSLGIKVTGKFSLVWMKCTVRPCGFSRRLLPKDRGSLPQGPC